MKKLKILSNYYLSSGRAMAGAAAMAADGLRLLMSQNTIKGKHEADTS